MYSTCSNLLNVNQYKVHEKTYISYCHGLIIYIYIYILFLYIYTIAYIFLCAC